MPGFPVLQCLLEFAQIYVHWVGDAISPSHHLPPPSPFAVNLSQHQSLFQWVGSSHQMAKVLELQRQQQSFQWIFRVDFLYDWLVWSPCSSEDSQESSPAPQCDGISYSAPGLPYGPALTSCVTTGKTITLTRWTFVGKVISLLFNTLPRFVIAFFPRSKCLLISWLQSLSAVILEPKKIRSATASSFSLSVCHERMGLDAVILVFLNIEFQANFFTLLFHPHQEAL